MLKATWKGEPETPDLKETVRFGIVFKKGEAVEVKNHVFAAKLMGNPNFTTEGKPEEPPPEQQLYPAPSEVSAQHPVPKPGEPVREEPLVVAVPQAKVNKVEPMKVASLKKV